MTNYLFFGGRLHHKIKPVADHNNVYCELKSIGMAKPFIEADDPVLTMANTDYYHKRDIALGNNEFRSVFVLEGFSDKRLNFEFAALMAKLFDTFVEVNSG